MLDLLFTVLAIGFIAWCVVIMLGILLLPVFAWMWWHDEDELAQARRDGLIK